MARTILQIQTDIIAAKNADATLAGLTSPSTTAIWRLWTYVIAFAMWTQEVLFDKHKAEVDDTIANTRPGTLKWYVYKAKQFQYGVLLPADTDVYPTVDESALVIKYAAAVELPTLLRVKVATITAGVLARVDGTATTGTLGAFNAYLARIKYAGVRVIGTSGDPDLLRPKINIYYDALVLDNSGQRLDGTSNTPVKDAINTFLLSLPFNGLFILNRLREYIETNVEGVVIGDIVFAEGNYAAVFTPIIYEYNPDAGYMILDDTYFNTYITYTAHGAV